MQSSGGRRRVITRRACGMLGQQLWSERAGIPSCSLNMVAAAGCTSTLLLAHLCLVPAKAESSHARIAFSGRPLSSRPGLRVGPSSRSGGGRLWWWCGGYPRFCPSQHSSGHDPCILHMRFLYFGPPSGDNEVKIIARWLASGSATTD